MDEKMLKNPIYKKPRVDRPESRAEFDRKLKKMSRRRPLEAKVLILHFLNSQLSLLESAKNDYDGLFWEYG